MLCGERGNPQVHGPHLPLREHEVVPTKAIERL
jgi:hypothetical protein